MATAMLSRSTSFRQFLCRTGFRAPSLSARLVSSSSEVTEEPRHSIAWTSLGLANSPLVLPHLQSIRQLPEVEEALTGAGNTVDSLQRAIQVFSTMGPGGNEHLATLSLLAEAQEGKGQYGHAVKTLQEIQQYSLALPLLFSQTVNLALAKALWLDGRLAESKLICDDMLESGLQSSPLLSASIRTGQAVSRLLLAESLDDVFSVKDPFRMVVKSLEAYPSLALAAAQLNFGVAEAVYAEIVGKARDIDVPLDGAMRSWKQGLTALKRVSKKDPRSSVAAAHLEARLQTNMAWGLMQMTRERDYLERASEFSSQALKVYERPVLAHEPKPGLGRTLALIAAKYHLSGGAVTAEGLFQSAVDQPATTPLEKLELIDTLSGYSSLCKNWEKRERDAEQLEERAATLSSSLPSGWKNKSVIYSSLWFWTPGHFNF